MKKEIIICALAATCLSVQGSVAKEVNKEVNVTRAYIPDVKPATKLGLTPDMSDDTYITPDIDYSITPSSIKTNWSSKVFKPTAIDLTAVEDDKLLYTKLGIGAPLSSDVDVYATPINTDKGYLVGFLNQNGEYSNQINDLGVDMDATQINWRGGVGGGLYLGEKRFDAKFQYNGDKWSRFATNSADYDEFYPLYQSIGFDAKFGDQFVDLSKFNYNVGANVDYFWSRSKFRDTKIGVAADFGRALGIGDLVVGINYDNIGGKYVGDGAGLDYGSGIVTEDSNYTNESFGLAASYDMGGEKWGAKLGLKYVFDKVSTSMWGNCIESYLGSPSAKKSIFLPDFNLHYNFIEDNLSLYVSSVGDVVRGDFASLSEQNPYILPGLYTSANGVDYDVDLGIRGLLCSGRLGYNVYVQYSYFKNKVYWQYVNIDNSRNYFTGNFADQECTSFNIELEYQPTSDLNFGMNLVLNDFEDEALQPLVDCDADVEFGFEAAYDVKRWQFGLGLDILSSRECSQLDIVSGSVSKSVAVIPTTADLGLSVDYRLKDSFVIFGEVSNILNQDLYDWARYCHSGIVAIVGVKMEF